MVRKALSVLCCHFEYPSSKTIYTVGLCLVNFTLIFIYVYIARRLYQTHEEKREKVLTAMQRASKKAYFISKLNQGLTPHQGASARVRTRRKSAAQIVSAVFRTPKRTLKRNQERSAKINMLNSLEYGGQDNRDDGILYQDKSERSPAFRRANSYHVRNQSLVQSTADNSSSLILDQSIVVGRSETILGSPCIHSSMRSLNDGQKFSQNKRFEPYNHSRRKSEANTHTDCDHIITKINAISALNSANSSCNPSRRGSTVSLTRSVSDITHESKPKMNLLTVPDYNAVSRRKGLKSNSFNGDNRKTKTVIANSLTNSLTSSPRRIKSNLLKSSKFSRSVTSLISTFTSHKIPALSNKSENSPKERESLKNRLTQLTGLLKMNQISTPQVSARVVDEIDLDDFDSDEFIKGMAKRFSIDQKMGQTDFQNLTRINVFNNDFARERKGSHKGKRSVKASLESASSDDRQQDNLNSVETVTDNSSGFLTSKAKKYGSLLVRSVTFGKIWSAKSSLESKTRNEIITEASNENTTPSYSKENEFSYPENEEDMFELSGTASPMNLSYYGDYSFTNTENTVCKNYHKDEEKCCIAPLVDVDGNILKISLSLILCYNEAIDGQNCFHTDISSLRNSVEKSPINSCISRYSTSKTRTPAKSNGRYNYESNWDTIDTITQSHHRRSSQLSINSLDNKMIMLRNNRPIIKISRINTNSDNSNSTNVNSEIIVNKYMETSEEDLLSFSENDSEVFSTIKPKESPDIMRLPSSNQESERTRWTSNTSSEDGGPVVQSLKSPKMVRKSTIDGVQRSLKSPTISNRSVFLEQVRKMPSISESMNDCGTSDSSFVVRSSTPIPPRHSVIKQNERYRRMSSPSPTVGTPRSRRSFSAAQ